MLYNMSKSFFSLALLVSVSSLMFANIHPALHNHNAQVNVQQDVATDDCSICLDSMQPNVAVQGLQCVQAQCRHRFHAACIAQWRARNNSCPTCRAPINAITAAVPVQPAPEPALRPAPQPVPQQAQRQQVSQQAQQAPLALDAHETAILQQLAQELSALEEDAIDILMINAYENPLILMDNDVFMNVLSTNQKNKVHELVSHYVARQAQADELAQQRQQAPVQALSNQGRALLQQLAQSLAPLQRDDIDILLMDAYNNPLILVESDALMAVLNNQQKGLLDQILAECIQ